MADALSRYGRDCYVGHMHIPSEWHPQVGSNGNAYLLSKGEAEYMACLVFHVCAASLLACRVGRAIFWILHPPLATSVGDRTK